MSTYDVIVIGAGIAGLSSCVKLLEEGISNILLLEAKNNIGGRIKTTEFQNNFIELGAQWIHGTKKNPIYELCKQIGNLDLEKNKRDTIYYSSQNGQPIDEEIVENFESKIEKIFDNLEEELSEDEQDEHTNLGDLLENQFNKLLRNLKPNETKYIELYKSIFNSRLNEENSNNGCDNLKTINAKGWNLYEDFDGDQFTKLKWGYNFLVNYFSSKLPHGCIRLNEIVEKIDWSSKMVTIVTNGKYCNNLYYAKKIICTIPLGCLKTTYQSLFIPSLPENKIKAIKKLGFGCVNKLFVVFDKPVADKKFGGLKLLWRNDEPFEFISGKRWNLNNNTFYKSMDNFEVLPNLENVLVCFVTGRDAIFIESLTEECLLEIVHELFHKFFPYLYLPKPKQIIRTKWNEEEFSKGSYSYIKIGSNGNDTKVLGIPLDNKVFFAGEATESKYIGTVHGAYISGRKRAKDVAFELLDRKSAWRKVSSSSSSSSSSS